MQPFCDYYRILQVHHEAGQEVIEAAYKRLCKLYHPDVNHEPQALERMKEINNAYSVVGDARQRRDYHRIWAAEAGRPGLGARPVSPGQPPQPRQNPAEAARRALDGYFRSLMDGDWEAAYAALTAADRRNVPLSDFRDWKSAVAQSYRIGSWAIKPFHRHINCTLAGALYREVQEFSVFVCDMDGRGRVSEENYLKYVALEGGAWRVCLGYADLKPLILRFRYFSENSDGLDPGRVFAEAVLNRDAQTGLMSRKAFLERAEAEAVRSRRYGNVFTVAMLLVRPDASAPAEDADYASLCAAHASAVARRCVRQTDVLARWGKAELAVLFTETPGAHAALAVRKLSGKLAAPAELKYSFSWGLAEFDGLELEDTVAAALSDAQVKRGARGAAGATITVHEFA